MEDDLIKKNISIIIILLLIISVCGCNDQKEKNDQNEIENIFPESIPLTIISLNESDLIDSEQIREDHYTEPYTASDLTGNNITWDIIEGYFTTFASDTSRLIESIIRFKSNETAQQNIELYKPFLLRTNTNFTEEQMEPIGEWAFLLKGERKIAGNLTSVFLLSFTTKNIFVSFQGFGFEKNQIVNYAKIIENNIIANM
jgi:hypothetical protein